MEDSRERLYFIHEVAKAIKVDHNNRHAKGLEEGRFSGRGFEKELEARYPQVGTSELFSTARKSVASLEKTPELNRGMDFDKVDALMKFIFRDHDAGDWPTVIEVVKTYAGGKFASYAGTAKTEEEKEIDRISAALSDQSNKPTHLKLLRVYVEEAILYYENNNNQMKFDQKRIEKLERREKTLKSAIKAALDRIKDKDGLTQDDKKAMADALKLLE